jgi:hypothetical protein
MVRIVLIGRARVGGNSLDTISNATVVNSAADVGDGYAAQAVEDTVEGRARYDVD